jgi:hypothetical protein
MKHLSTLVIAALLAWACDSDDSPGYNDGWLDSDVPTDTSGSDTSAGCTSTTPYCSADHMSVLQCNPSTGSVTTLEECSAGEACVGGACTAVACVPGTAECLDEDTQRVCRDDGTGWIENPCGEDMRCYSDEGRCDDICMIRLFILLDQSGSMTGETSPTKWEQARTAIQSVMTSETADDVEFGFGAFPSDGDCAADDIVIYPVPEATPSNVDAYFSDGPSGNTPLTDAMKFFETDTTANLRNSAYHNALLVVSDGMDSCFIDCMSRCATSAQPFVCLVECEQEIEPLAAAELSMTTANLRDNHQIRSFVVGFGSDVSEMELNAIAANGGTSMDSYIQASDVSDLEAAFQTILDEMWQCNDIII